MHYKLENINYKYIKWEGRILNKESIAYMGYTNSSLSIMAEGTMVKMYLATGENEEVNQPGLRVYVDGKAVNEVVLTKKRDWYDICRLEPGKIHDIKVVKITEAAMSYVGLISIEVCDGRLYEFEERDERTKVEFIGDSITCGYGVHGAPDSEYTIREEDGECCYASFMAKEMNWNARWIAASGFGMYVEYTGNPENNVPKLYPYVNWFINKQEEIKKGEFEPKFIFVNLGTNDSGHLDKPEILDGFLKAYEEFLKTLRSYHKNAVIICVLGTLCEVYPYVEQVVEKVKNEGMKNVYSFELPYHDVEKDGMASGHPTEATHRKDAKRILDFMREQGMIE